MLVDYTENGILAFFLWLISIGFLWFVLSLSKKSTRLQGSIWTKILKILAFILFGYFSLVLLLRLSGYNHFQNELQEAIKGNAEAQESIATDYKYGWNGASKNQEKAAFWYRKSANQDNPEAHFMLGLMYWGGEGVIKNPELAIQHFTAALCKGKEEAASCIADIKNGQREYLERSTHSFSTSIYEHLRAQKEREEAVHSKMVEAYGYYLYAKSKNTEQTNLIENQAQRILSSEEQEQSYQLAQRLENDSDCGLKIWDYGTVYIAYDERPEQCGSGGCPVTIIEQGQTEGNPIQGPPEIYLEKNQVVVSLRQYGGLSGSRKEIIPVDFSHWKNLEKKIFSEVVIGQSN